jgi:diguanylate cyclase (GGDEF)-like protein
MALLTLVSVLVLLFQVVPAVRSSGVEQRQQIQLLGQAELLVSGTANDQRGFLLNGQPEFLVEVTDKSEEAQHLMDGLAATTPMREQVLLRSALTHFQQFLGTHDEVVGLVRAGREERAIQLAITTGRDERKAGQADLAAAKQLLLRRVAQQSDNELRIVILLGVALLLLSAFLVGASALLRRGARREQAAAIDLRRAADQLCREQRSVALLQSLANSSDSLADAVQVCLQGIRAGTGWQIAHFYLHDSEGRPVARDSWSLADGDRYAAFVHASSHVPAAGLRNASVDSTTRMVRRLSPLQADPRFTDPAVACLGLRHGALISIPAGVGHVAVLEFLWTSPSPLSVETTAVLEHVGAHLGRLLERDRAVEELRHSACHDPLTGLANRMVLHQRLEEMLQATSTGSECAAALIVLDLDDFKVVNDSLGHVTGDALLVAAADRLSTVTGEEGIVIRLGGDEFAVLMNTADETDAVRLGERILAEFHRDFRVQRHTVRTTASVGITVEGAIADKADLLRNADLAMYAAKSAGKGKLAVYRREMLDQARQHLDLTNHLRHAIERQEMHVAYQPIVDADTGDLRALEALLRWDHPAWGAVAPETFIPAAERSGTILLLGEWVLRTACRDARQLADRHGRDVRMAVNVSARQLQSLDFVTVVQSALDDSGLHPALLTLEVTESLLMEHHHSIVVLHRLHQLGVHLAIDDFGTGHSSLARLRMLPVTDLKIDRAFIKEITPGDCGPIITAVLAMGHALGLNVVAEGVETQMQLQALTGLQCDAIQGYLISPPVPLSGLRLDTMPWMVNTFPCAGTQSARVTLLRGGPSPPRKHSTAPAHVDDAHG